MPNILLIGHGKMGSALLNGWLSASLKNDYIVIDPAFNSNDLSIKILKSINQINDIYDVIVLAVKPQIMDEVRQSLKPFVTPKTLIISIAAGKKIDFFIERFGPKQPIVRAMPNTPATIGAGITVAIQNQKLSEDGLDLANKLLNPLGLLEWIDDENLMDAVTAVSGSGPAYVFLLMGELSKAGQARGLPANLADTLARQTVIGSALLAQNEKDLSPKILRENVTSPGGTTEAALKILMNNNGFSNILERAIEAATKRSQELS